MADEVLMQCVRELGYKSLKEEQKKIITSFIQGSDVFGVLPTGYGKSLCYACLPNVFDRLQGSRHSIIVVITAIMKDQVSTKLYIIYCSCSTNLSSSTQGCYNYIPLVQIC